MVLKAIFLGIIQGLTEFLPVSSTGHLIVVEHFLGISQTAFGLIFDVALHLGTLVALVGYFWRELVGLFSTKVVVATLPAVVFGLVFEKQIETFFRQPFLVALALIFFGLVIWWADRRREGIEGVEGTEGIGMGKALIIGVFQSLALFPGVSRSGATISGGMFLGLKREVSARFAFLLSIPIIFGASAKQLIDFVPVAMSLSVAELNFFIAGFMAATITGFLTIKYFLVYLKSARLWPFVIYRIALGLLIIGLFW